ncbi:MAG: J domain-containing protein [Micavibrio sp.]|nr:J domain-containing protein [Micavibrio sp.]
MPGCMGVGEHKAPKHRGLNEYYMFCVDHVREYNKSWNYFDGLSDDEVQEHMYKSMYGDRPTWKYGVNGNAEDELYDKIWRSYHGEDAPPHRGESEKERRDKFHATHKTPEHEALAVMGLEPPVDLKAIKVRYKELAKKHHPDLNKGCQKSEEQLKKINMAYTVLRLAYEAYEKLPQKG